MTILENEIVAFKKEHFDTHGTYDKKNDRYFIPVSGEWTVIKNGEMIKDQFYAGDALHNIDAAWRSGPSTGLRTINTDFLNKPIGIFNGDL